MINNRLWILGRDKRDIHLLDSLLPENFFQSIRYVLLQDLDRIKTDTPPSVLILLWNEDIKKDHSILTALPKEGNFPPVIIVSEETSPKNLSELNRLNVHTMFFRKPSRNELESALESVINYISDGTAKKQHESPFRMHEKFIRYFYNVPVSTIILNKDLEIVKVNNSLAAINGMTPERHTGKKLRDLMPDIADQLEPTKKQLYQTDKKHINFQVSIHKPDRPEKFYHLFASFFLLENNNSHENDIGGYLFNLNDYDIIFKKLKTYKEEYGHLFERAPIGILLMDTSGNIRELNIEMARILGETTPLAIQDSSKKFHRILNLEKQKWQEFIYLLTEKGHVENFEIKGEGANGLDLWLSISAQINFDSSGKSPLINAFVNNINDRIKAEKEASIIKAQIELVNELNDDLTARSHISEIIRKTCDKLRDIYQLRFADLYLHRTDSEGNEYIVYQYSNIDSRLLSTVEKLSGLSLKEMKIPLFEGSNFSTLYHKGMPLEFSGHDKIADIIKDYVDPSKKTLRNLAGQVSRIAGNKYIYLVPLITQRHTIGHIGFNRDIPFTDNEKRAIQTVIDKLSSVFERDQNEKMIRYSLHEKDTLLKEIHHRVKNNMQIISSFLALQSISIEDRTTKEHFIESQNRIKSMAMIHEQLYRSGDLSKINFNEYLTLLGEEIKKAYTSDTNKITIQTNAENLYLEIQRAIPCSLIANELISNSIKHAFPDKEEGTISVSFRKEANHSYKLIVSDNGIGFDEDLFQKSHNSLGIQLIKDLTKQLNGTLQVNNTEDNSVIISFSDAGEHLTAEYTKIHDKNNKDATSILIVEDDIITASFLKNQLEKEGYYIPAIISTGEEAVAYCDIAPPDIIIMDILLAGEMDGIEAARRIKSIHDTALLYASGNSEDFSLVKAQKTSPVGFIVKPINIQDVLRLIAGVSK